MSGIEELEAALQQRWDLTTLAVYADALIARGDPRGELIAIDLEIAARGRTPALHARRRELAQGWLADTELGFVRARLFRTSTQPGTTVAGLFASPACRWLRHLHLLSSATRIKLDVHALVERPLPWLHEISFAPNGVSRPTPIPDEDIAALAAAAPNLHRIVAVGDPLLRTPIPASVRSLAVMPSSFIVGAEPAPNVVELTLLPVSGSPAGMARDAGLANPRLFPALRELDVRRNTPWEDPHDDDVSLRTFVEHIDGFDRIERLRIPAPRPGRVADVLAILDHYPRLAIETDPPPAAIAVTHARLRIPPPHPWPAWDVARHSVLRVGSHEIGLGSVVLAVETHDPTMTAGARAAWRELWRLLDASEGRFEVDTDVVRAAFEALHDDAPFDVAELIGARTAIERKPAPD